MAIPDAEIEAMQLFAARAGAGYLSLESAAALAALPALLSRGLINPTDLVVALDTGAGFKSEAPDVRLPAPLRNDPSTWPGA